MTRRLTFLLLIVLIALVALTLAACEKERPVPTPSRTTPAAAGGTAAPTTRPPAAITQAAPAAAQPTAAPVTAATPAAPTPQPVVVTPSGASGSTGGGQAFTYTVAAGDTLATLATKFGTTPEAIAQLNNLSDPNALVMGQQLKIVGTMPEGASATGATGSGGTSVYVVVAGDTLGTIAKRFGTTVAQLVQLNNLTDPDRIAVGQKLTIPGAGGAAPAASTTPSASGQGQKYVIQKGDTLLSIARKFGVTVKQVQDANNITDPDRIYPGQELVIP
jgi:LysM repeat protein